MHSFRNLSMTEEHLRLLQKTAFHQFQESGSQCEEVISGSPVLDLEKLLPLYPVRRVFRDPQKLEDYTLDALNAIEHFGQDDSRVDAVAINCGLRCGFFNREDVVEKQETYRDNLAKRTCAQIELLGINHPDLTERIADGVALWVRNPKKGLSVDLLYLAQERYLDSQDDIVLQRAADIGVGHPLVKDGLAQGLARKTITLDHIAYAQKSFLHKQQSAVLGPSSDAEASKKQSDNYSITK